MVSPAAACSAATVPAHTTTATAFPPNCVSELVLSEFMSLSYYFDIRKVHANCQTKFVSPCLSRLTASVNIQPGAGAARHARGYSHPFIHQAVSPSGQAAVHRRLTKSNVSCKDTESQPFSAKVSALWLTGASSASKPRLAAAASTTPRT